jgi:hypothetical protein
MNEQPTTNDRALAPSGAVAAGASNPLVTRAIADLDAAIQPA